VALRIKFLLIFLLTISNIEAVVFNGDLTKILVAKPGEIFNVKLTMTNNKDVPEEVHINQADYKYNSNGENFFEEPNTLERSNAKWLELHQQSVRIEPGQTKDVYYTVRVPNNPQLKGSYSSAILIEPTEPVTTLQAENAVSIQIKVRYAHQIIVNVGALEKSLKLLDSNLLKTDTGHTLNMDVENNGNCHLYPHPTLKLYDLKGQLVKTMQAAPQNILPYNSVRFSLPLEEISEGEYYGLLLLDVGNGKLFAERLSLSIH
jgi:hypothetical protein